MTAGPEEAPDACDQLFRAFRPDRALQISLPAVAQAAGIARQHTREALALWQLDHLTDTAVLLVSELVGNVVRHASSGSGLQLQITAGRSLVIAVTDADPRLPQPRRPAQLDETGLGFVLVDSLATRWGVDPAATGKTVWVELDTGQDTQPGRRPGRNPALALDTGPPVITRRVVSAVARTLARRTGPAIRRGR